MPNAQITIEAIQAAIKHIGPERTIFCAVKDGPIERRFELDKCAFSVLDDDTATIFAKWIEVKA